MDTELLDYIIRYCRKEMTSDEKTALRRLSLVNTDFDQPRFNTHEMEKWYQFKNENVNFLVSMGAKKLKEKIASRIYIENKDKVINLCPRCGKLTRTPKSKQCRHCFFDWH